MTVRADSIGRGKFFRWDNDDYRQVDIWNDGVEARRVSAGRTSRIVVIPADADVTPLELVPAEENAT